MPKTTQTSVTNRPLKHARGSHYSADQIRAAIAAAYTANIDEPTGIAALTAARLVLGDNVHKSSMAVWIRKYGEEVKALIPDNTAQIVRDTQDQILRQWHEVRQASLERAKATVSTAGYRDVMVGAGISDDHILKRQAVPIEIEQAIRKLQADCNVLRWDYTQVLVDFVAHVHSKAIQPAPSADIEITAGDSASDK